MSWFLDQKGHFEHTYFKFSVKIIADFFRYRGGVTETGFSETSL